jgi:hypothetical protein
LKDQSKAKRKFSIDKSQKEWKIRKKIKFEFSFIKRETFHFKRGQQEVLGNWKTLSEWETLARIIKSVFSPCICPRKKKRTEIIFSLNSCCAELVFSCTTEKSCCRECGEGEREYEAVIYKIYTFFHIFQCELKV